jgi:hypothetical protein
MDVEMTTTIWLNLAKKTTIQHDFIEELIYD